ncbi:nitroreductase family protein [Phenylobacterium zucineum HLK1]|uniref:Putative NAD(P)H nitroreductase n=1 Tax=Phenylobacterium zucineum (strain HLK1) TaxID=450851 RepID=B4RF67_PHEZH|nr:nitroreductase [Phenylobacterium zucineum]ACG78637.1 nitroreductase family protein [Phenylobacterium zucineum HLK1]
MSSDLPPVPEFGAPLPIAPVPEVLRFLALRRSAPALTLAEPGPSSDQLGDLLRLAGRAPDHGKLSPWRFVLLEGEAKTAFADRLEALARGRGDATQAAKLGKLRTPPLAIVVVSRVKPGAIPEWEQVLSAGAVCTNLLNAAQAMGYGANWITDWYSFDSEAQRVLGLAEHERVAGFIMIGTPREPPLERERMDVGSLVTRWKP